MKLFEYIDLPKIPEYLTQEIYNSINNPDAFPGKSKIYSIHDGTKPLYEFVHQYFDSNYLVQAQQIIGGTELPMHTDFRRNCTYNFLIDCGGEDVYTSFYNEDRTLIERHKIEPFRWHLLNTSVLHGVTGTELGRNRVGVSVFLHK